MAVLTVQEPIDMLGLPSAMVILTLISDATELSVYKSGVPTTYMSFLGTFQQNPTAYVQGTVTHAEFNLDSNFISDIVISGLNFALDVNYFGSYVDESNFAKVVEDMLSGDDTVNGSSGADTLSGFAGNDTVFGKAGADHLIGDIGKDRLFGGDGADTMYGGGAADLLVGGAGADSMTGNVGADIFQFLSINDIPSRAMLRDTIEDFSRAEGDKIDLSQIDARLISAGNQAFEFIGTGKFTGNGSDNLHRGELRVQANASGFTIFADVTGDKFADFAIDIVTFVADLKSTDFML